MNTRAGHDLSHLVVLVTGAGGGIGTGVAMRLASQGAFVGVADLTAALSEPVAEAIASAGGRAVPLAMDVSAGLAVADAVQRLENAAGLVNSLVTCAGLVYIKDFLDVDETAWRKTMDVNLLGTYLCFKEVAARLVRKGQPGQMVAIASIAGKGPNPIAVDYGASKAGVVNLVKSAAVALAPYGITANAVCPGIVDTKMIHEVHDGVGKLRHQSGEQALADRVATIPLGRIATPDDVAGPVAFFLSKDASYITGQALNVCGGIEFD